MKTIYVFLVLSLFLNPLFPEENTNKNININVNEDVESPIYTVAKNSFFGGAVGLLAGIAIHLIAKPDNVSNLYSYAIGGGILLGMGYSIYDLASRNGKPRTISSLETKDYQLTAYKASLYRIVTYEF